MVTTSDRTQHCHSARDRAGATQTSRPAVCVAVSTRLGSLRRRRYGPARRAPRTPGRAGPTDAPAGRCPCRDGAGRHNQRRPGGWCWRPVPGPVLLPAGHRGARRRLRARGHGARRGQRRGKRFRRLDRDAARRTWRDGAISRVRCPETRQRSRRLRQAPCQRATRHDAGCARRRCSRTARGGHGGAHRSRSALRPATMFASRRAAPRQP